jgi:hypothetical protein
LSGTASAITFSAGAAQTATTGSAGDTFSAIQTGDENITSGAGDDTFNILAAADFVAGLTINGGAGTADNIVIADANTSTVNLNTPGFTNIEGIDVGQVNGASTITMADGFVNLKGDATSASITFSGTGAQLSAISSLTLDDGTQTLNLTVSDAGGALDLTGLAAVTTVNTIDVITMNGSSTLTIDTANTISIVGIVAAAGAADVLQIADTSTVATALFDAFETVTITGSGANLTMADLNVAQTINGEAGDNDIILADTQATADTVNISQGGVDRVSFDGVGNDTAVTAVTGFTAGTGAGADVIDLNTTTGAIAADVTTAVVFTTGATIDTDATAAGVTKGVVLAASAAQVTGTLTGTGDGGAVETAIIAGGLITATGDSQNEQINDGFFYAVLDNGVSSGIYRVNTTAANIGDTNLNAANEIVVTLVGTIDVADAGTLVGTQFI